MVLKVENHYRLWYAFWLYFDNECGGPYTLQVTKQALRQRGGGHAVEFDSVHVQAGRRQRDILPET